MKFVAVEAATPDGLAQAVASLPDGGVIQLAAGDHTVRRTVPLPSGITIVGEGADATVITLEPGANCHIFTNADHDEGNAHIELRGFTALGNMRTQVRPQDTTGLLFSCGGYLH